MNMLMNQKEVKFKKIGDLLVFLSENNEYYSKILKKYNINISDIENSFEFIPIQTKKDIRENFSQYISRNLEDKIEELTSGSTGMPLKCYKTSSERISASLTLWNERKKHDKKITPYNFMPIVGMQTYNEIGDFCLFSYENMKKCFNGMMERKPRMICGPPTTIYQYARLIKKGLLDYEAGIIKFIELSGEYVDIKQKKYIEEAFKCKCLNQYGTRECWCIAYECIEGHLHVVKDVYVETVNQNNDVIINAHAAGEITITSLYNKLMPFVRYNIGDMGIVEYKKCICGVESQIITLAGGRNGDIIKGKVNILGDIFFKRAINDLIEAGFDIIESFRVEQISENHFRIYIVPTTIFAIEASEFLSNTIKRGLGSETEVEYCVVGNIPTLNSGKLKTFVCLV